MTDVELVLVKLARMREHIALARRRRPPTPEELSSDVDRRDALALAVLVAAQEAIDIAYHIVADEGWSLPESHAAAFDALAAHGVIEQDLAARVANVGRVRNRIAHGYASVDHERMWRELPEGLDALDAYAVAVSGWLPVM